MEKFPKTILGVEAAKRGQVEKAWRSSKIIRKRRWLKNMRIEVRKYLTSKKRIDTPEKHQYFAQKEEEKKEKRRQELKRLNFHYMSHHFKSDLT